MATLRHTPNNNNNNNMANQSCGQLYGMKQQSFSVYRKCKVSPSRRLKNLLKPLLGHVFKSKAKQPKRNSYIACEEKEAEFEWLDADHMDNMANEDLEQRIMNELQQCDDDAAFIVYTDDGERKLEAVNRKDLYVPVHFARTDEGTFFWTSMQRETIEPYKIEWNFMDRWGQA